MKCLLCIFFLGDSVEREKKRKGSGSSGSVVHWSDFQPSSSESTNRLLNSQKTLHSSHKFGKQHADPSHRSKGDSRAPSAVRLDHRYHPPPEEHPPPVSAGCQICHIFDVFIAYKYTSSNIEAFQIIGTIFTKRLQTPCCEPKSLVWINEQW